MRKNIRAARAARTLVQFFDVVCQISNGNRTEWSPTGLLQLAITWYKIRHAGGQADYYSRTGTLKQRDLSQ